MIDPTTASATPASGPTLLLEANLALLPLASQQALRAATAQPPISLRVAGTQLRASVQTDDGRWVAVHASEDPLAASMAVAQRFALSKPPLVVVVGLGLGYLLDALEATASAARVLAIEPMPAITRAMLTRRDWSGWLSSGRLTLLTGPDYSGSSEVWGLFGRGAATPPIIMAPMMEREFPEEAARARGLVRQIVAGAKANEEARRQFAGRYLLNTLHNVARIGAEGDSAALSGAFSRVPAVVVAAGPSLDRNVRDLIKLEGRVLIIAVDTALRPLLAAGIRPHLVVSVDPSELNARHLEGIRDCRGSWLVAEGSVDPSARAQFAGRTFTFKVSQHHPWPWLESHGLDRGRLRAWGSVLTTAFDLAVRAGCDPIVFAGADLAYTGGLQYCRNTTYEEKWRDFPTDEARAALFKTYLAERPHLTQPDVHGGEVITAPHFVQFRDWIVSRANEAADRRVVNATGGGILHGGRLTQTDFSVLHLPKVKHDVGFHRRLHAAWSAGLSARRSALTGLHEAFVSGRSSLPLDAWIEFAGDTVSQPLVDAAIAATAAGVARQTSRDRYLGTRAAEADAHAVTLDEAQTWIHPHYAQARQQAEGQLAHVLLDHLQRTHAIVTPADTRGIIDSATTRPGRLKVLDVGCGLGRTMEPLVAAGHEVDGVDISQTMIDLARRQPSLGASRFFVSDGDDCGAAADGAYDIATLHLTLHVITCRSVRRSLLRAVARALKPEGTLVADVPFFADGRAEALSPPDVSWTADLDEAPASPVGEVRATPEMLPDMYRDFSAIFSDVRFQFVDSPHPSAGAHSRSMTHLIVSASATPTLAARMHALPPTAAKRDTVLVFPSAQKLK